jgi:hypothetical protein
VRRAKQVVAEPPRLSVGVLAHAAGAAPSAVPILRVFLRICFALALLMMCIGLAGVVRIRRSSTVGLASIDRLSFQLLAYGVVGLGIAALAYLAGTS